MDAPPIQYALTADGVKIAYWTLGEGQPLIEQPQAPYSHCERIWQVPWASNWFTHLAARRQIVFFDHRGHGLSDRDVSDYSPAALALDIAAVADRLGLDRFDLLGAGYPSAGAILFAAEHPGRIRRLALWQPLAHGDASHNNFKDLLPLIDKDFDYYVEGALRWSNPDLTPQEFADALAFYRLCFDPPALRAAYEAYAQFDVRDALERVQAVAIVLDHRGDRVLREGALGEVAAALPRGSLRLLEASAANPFRTPDWEAAALALEQFLDAPDPDSLHPTAAQSRAPQATLTRRERDVLRLLVVGQRNRDIAAALDVAPATVASHVSNLLHKTGCANRTELARYAADRGLTSEL